MTCIGKGDKVWLFLLLHRERARHVDMSAEDLTTVIGAKGRAQYAGARKLNGSEPTVRGAQRGPQTIVNEP